MLFPKYYPLFHCYYQTITPSLTWLLRYLLTTLLLTHYYLVISELLSHYYPIITEL